MLRERLQLLGGNDRRRPATSARAGERSCRTACGRTRPCRDCSRGAYARYGVGQHVNGSIARGLAVGLADGLCRASLTTVATVEALIAELADDLVTGLNSGRPWRTVGPAAAGLERLRMLLTGVYHGPSVRLARLAAGGVQAPRGNASNGTRTAVAAAIAITNRRWERQGGDRHLVYEVAL
jgi:hypothetical protein